MTQARFVNMNFKTASTQGGAVLVVALIILTALTLVGVSSMQSTTLEMRMVNSSIERSKSFTEVEAAIAEAIKVLEQEVDSLEDLHSGEGAFFTPSCEGGSAENPGGWCFFGKYTSDMSYTYECNLEDPDLDDPREIYEPWHQDSNLAVWSTEGRHRSSQVMANVKYIVEFKCFVGRDRHAPYGPYLGGSDEADPLFIITAYMESSSGRPPIMIQVSHTVRI